MTSSMFVRERFSLSPWESIAEISSGSNRKVKFSFGIKEIYGISTPIANISYLHLTGKYNAGILYLQSKPKTMQKGDFMDHVAAYPLMPCESCALADTCDGSDCPTMSLASIYDEETAADAAKE